jgi:ribosomal protein L4
MMELKNELVVIERSLWTNDAEVDAANLTKEAVLVFAETGVIRRDVAIEAIRRENAEGRRWASVQFENVLCLPVAEGRSLAQLPRYGPMGARVFANFR